jgi:hypothetical protein
MCAAFTTAAVINHSMNPPEKAATPLDFMPNHRAREREPELTDEELEERSDYQVRLLNMAAKLKAQQRTPAPDGQ